MSNKNLSFLPKHIWIIMDGNRRWAKQRHLPKIMGHKVWADNVVKITNIVEKIWTKYLTLWALSVDNLNKRDPGEVEAIIKLVNSIEKYLDKMQIENLKFETIWDISKLPKESREILQKVKDKTKNNTWITLILALIYWGQDEIVRATKKIISSWLDPEKLDREEFRKFTDSWAFPKVDLIIRTGWDIRHSWFLLYDSEYSEYYFTDKKWPEFDEEELNKAINQYSSSKRNFWK